ncbi:MAG: hypothetical protein II206_09785 [Bacteroidaceae bacterium]|nr:hypothetical protein [Bacteroidaceae bacterium]
MNLIIVARNRYGRGAALGEGDNQQLAQVFRNIGVQRLEQDMNHQTLFCGGQWTQHVAQRIVVERKGWRRRGCLRQTGCQPGAWPGE